MAGPWLLAGAGAAWVGAALYYKAWLEVVYCFTIASGFFATAWGLRRPGKGRHAVFAGGLALAGLGLATPVFLYGFLYGQFGVSDLSWLLCAGGVFLASVSAFRWSRNPASGVKRVFEVRVGMAVASAGALLIVLASDISGLSLWTPGNLSLLAGTILFAAFFRDPTLRPSRAAAS